MKADGAMIPNDRDAPLYTLHEASLFLDIPIATLRSWIFGRSYVASGKKVFWKPIITLPNYRPYEYSLSFYNLAEAHVLAATRSYDVKVKAIRDAIAYVSEKFPSPHPLLSQDFLTDGKSLFVKKIEETINVSQFGQMGLSKILDAYLLRIRRDEIGWPARFFPVVSDDFKNNVICIAPGIGSGRPVIDQRGIRASVVWQRYEAGETIPELADDYEINASEIEQAVNYYRHIKQAA